jgi:hypothetical protein
MCASSFVLDSGYDLPPSWTDEHATTHKKRARSRALFGSATGFAPRACGSLDQNRPRWKGATGKPAAAPAQLSPRPNPVQGRLGFSGDVLCDAVAEGPILLWHFYQADEYVFFPKAKASVQLLSQFLVKRLFHF